MNNKADEILKRLEQFEQNIQAKPSKFSTIFLYFEKLLLPVALGFLAFVTQQASIKISETQLELAKVQIVNQESAVKENFQIKYFELFYNDITSKNPDRQLNAISLLKLMKPELVTLMGNWIESNPNISPKVKVQARSLGKSIALVVLQKYKIAIYYPQNSDVLSVSANAIKDGLIQYGLKEDKVRVYGKDNSFLERMVSPRGFEIRYEPDEESEAAEILQNVLKEVYPEREFRKQRVGVGTTKNFISIFLGK